MEKTRFYPPIWTMTPFGFDVVRQWYAHDKKLKEIVLKNTLLHSYRVSELDLNITKLAVIDGKGNEQRVLDFPGQNSVKIKGMSSGHFLKSSDIVSWQPGTYSILRVYFDRKNAEFTLSDGSVRAVSSFDYFDFTMENELMLKNDEKTEIKLWFNLAPRQVTSPFTFLKDWIKRKKAQFPRLAGNMG